MSTYNGEKYLREQIDSIINQKLDVDWDLIVRDDGSSDSTKEILKEYAKLKRLIFVAGENVGAAKGFIYLLRDYPEYDFYAFSDQDDVWNEGKLQKGIDAIKEIEGPALYCTNCELVDSELKSIGRNTHRERPTYTLESILCLACCAQGCTSVFNRKLAEIVQNNDLPKTFIMHDSLITCLCGLVGGEIIYDDSPSMKYRMHGSNVFGMVSAKQNVGNLLKDRANEIFKKKKISAYAQAKSILETYEKYIPEKNIKLCKVVIAAERHIPSRLKLVFNNNLRHDTMNKTITKKLEILLGND